MLLTYLNKDQNQHKLPKTPNKTNKKIKITPQKTQDKQKTPKSPKLNQPNKNPTLKKTHQKAPNKKHLKQNLQTKSKYSNLKIISSLQCQAWIFLLAWFTWDQKCLPSCLQPFLPQGSITTIPQWHCLNLFRSHLYKNESQATDYKLGKIPGRMGILTQKCTVKCCCREDLEFPEMLLTLNWTETLWIPLVPLYSIS